jgi:hypothetical protein
MLCVCMRARISVSECVHIYVRMCECKPVLDSVFSVAHPRLPSAHTCPLLLRHDDVCMTGIPYFVFTEREKLFSLLFVQLCESLARCEQILV